MQQKITLGGIFGEYGERYITENNLSGPEKGLVRLLSACRGPALGSHYEKCDHCGHRARAYNSCRNRHCPLCQQKEKAEWLEKQMAGLLPTGYFHMVFTLPHQLNALCLANKKVMYGLLFRAASGAVLELARDTRHLGADTGLLAVLHTWGQNLREHPHLHCIMPAGGLSFDRSHWVHTPKGKDFFVHYKALSRLFRGKYLAFLAEAFEKGQLHTKGILATKGQFYGLTAALRGKEWVVNIQPPFGRPEKVLEYLSRYVFRTAISNSRILAVRDGKVEFSWKDYRTGHFGKMKLETGEFIRRFLLHVLPKGFFKVRYYGIFASRYRNGNTEKARQLLGEESANMALESLADGMPCPVRRQHTFWDEIWPQIQQYQKPNCPKCKKGRLRFAGLVPRE